MESNEWFGVVRWHNDDIAVKLEEIGIKATDENIKTVRKNCENNHFFKDTMIIAGWDMIEETINVLQAGGYLK